MRKPLRLLLVLALAGTSMSVLPVSADPGAGSDAPEVPGFLTGPNDGAPEDIAVSYFQEEAGEYGLRASDVSDLAVRSAVKTRQSGATHVNLNQRFEGLEVFGADTTVTITEDGEVAFVGGASIGDLRAAPGSMRAADVTAPQLDAVAAVEAAADGLDLAEPVGLEVEMATMSAASADDEVVLSDGGISEEPITATLGWQPTPDGLVLAWSTVIDDNASASLWNATVDAATGALLDVDDWTIHHDHDDLADMAERLGRGDQRGAASATSTSTTPITTPNPVIDGSSYRVYPLPAESPLDPLGRHLITNPADRDASPYGWHDVTATPGADFTITRGNNTNTYLDWNNSNNPNNARLSVTVDEGPAAGTYTAVAAGFGPSVGDGVSGEIVTVNAGGDNPTQGCAPLIDFPDGAIAHADRGGCSFVEIVGFAQAAGAIGVIVGNNVAGAPIVMGGADPSITIPSVMISLPDANTLKTGLPAEGSMSQVSLPSQPEGGADLTFDHPIDLTAHPHDYWEAAVTNLFYWCNTAHDVYWHYGFDEATGNFQQNNYGRGGVGGDPVNCEAQDGGGTNNANMATPAQDGNSPRMQMYLWTGNPVRDGDLENGIILHEYSHGISLRTTGGPGINCLSGQQQQGEGWSDYHAIALLIDPELDDPEEARGMGTYAVRNDDPDRRGAGIRPRPYSRNMEIQPFTYEGVRTGGWLGGGSLAQPHGIGHAWAAVLWDMTWDLIDKHGFNPDVYGDWSTGGNNLAQQLVMDGLKIQGCGPNFVTSRAAIIAADQILTGGENQCTLWASFARRGLGYSAASANTNRNSAIEAFDTHPACREGFRAPVTQAYGDLTERSAGSNVPLRFDAGRGRGADILAGEPFSRQVSCDTLRVVSQGANVTPRALPIPLETPGRTGLSHNPQGTYHLNWKTDADWSGTCREVVMTLDDGVQHRAFFRFT